MDFNLSVAEIVSPNLHDDSAFTIPTNTVTDFDFHIADSSHGTAR